MSERVRVYRERQREKGMALIAVWLDQAAVALLKCATETLRLQPGEVVTLALREWQDRNGNATETVSVTDRPSNGNVTEHVTETLREQIRQIVREELVQAGIRNDSVTLPKPDDAFRIGNATDTVSVTGQEAIPGNDQGQPYGVTLKTARATAGLSLEDLASRARVRKFTIQQIEAGIKEPTLEQREKLDNALFLGQSSNPVSSQTEARH